MKRFLFLASLVSGLFCIGARMDLQAQNQTGGKILIAYFSWAHNTEPPRSNRNLDGTSGASAVVPGDTGKIAGFIRNRVNAPVHIITVDHKYANNYNDCYYEGLHERDANIRHRLTSRVADMDSYDVIFLGFPNWWYGLPMAVYSFLEGYDFSGKTIIPFVTHGTGGLAGTIRQLTAALPGNCKILRAFDVYERNVNSAQNNVNAWLAGLGY
jgi:flavodoxin